MDPDIDPGRYHVATFEGRGIRQAYVHEGVGGVPLLLVHGWPESKRIFWKVIGPLAAAGFEVVVPDLRGFGDSEPGPKGTWDVAAYSRDLHALVTEGLGHRKVVLVGGDLGGPVVQDLALRFPDVVERMVLFNTPVPYIKASMAHLATRSATESSDYYVRQGSDADALAAELRTPEERRRYIATFYTSRFWAHPGAFIPVEQRGKRFNDTSLVDFHTEPFGDAATLRASFGCYEATLKPEGVSEPALLAPNPDVRTLILFGPSDHVLYPAFDQMAAAAFPDHVGPFLLRDCGHFVPWEAPGPFTSGITAFCGDLLATHQRS